MQITAAETKLARSQLGLSQMAVCKATGIPRNIMSAFEQKKIVLLDDMQSDLVNYFESQGLDSTASEAANDSESSFESAPGPHDGDLFVRDGFCIPSGLDLDNIDETLVQVHDIETEIDDSLSYRVHEDGFIFKSMSDRSRARHERLVLLYVKWACLVQRLHGRRRDVVPSSQSELEEWPEDQHQLMCQTLAKEFGAADEAA